MDKTLTALIARFRRLEWRAETDHHVGERGGIVVTVWDDGGDLDNWHAFATGDGIRIGAGGNSAVEAVEKLAAEVQLSAALSGLPAEPEEWPPANMPGPAALGGGCLLLVVDIIVSAALWVLGSQWGAFALFAGVAVAFVAYFGGFL